MLSNILIGLAIPRSCSASSLPPVRLSDPLVTWVRTDRNNFMGKAFSLIMDCEKLVRPQFEKGLGSMKAVAESVTKA